LPGASAGMPVSISGAQAVKAMIANSPIDRIACLISVNEIFLFLDSGRVSFYASIFGYPLTKWRNDGASVKVLVNFHNLPSPKNHKLEETLK